MSTESNGNDEERPRGFARLTPEQRRALGSKGGRTAHERGTANKFTSDVASRAGKIPHQKGTAHHWTSEQARDAGRKGGVAARKTRAERAREASANGNGSQPPDALAEERVEEE
jgi:general stress protein YciG